MTTCRQCWALLARWTRSLVRPASTTLSTTQVEPHHLQGRHQDRPNYFDPHNHVDCSARHRVWLRRPDLPWLLHRPCRRVSGLIWNQQGNRWPRRKKMILSTLISTCATTTTTIQTIMITLYTYSSLSTCALLVETRPPSSAPTARVRFLSVLSQVKIFEEKELILGDKIDIFFRKWQNKPIRCKIHKVQDFST